LAGAQHVIVVERAFAPGAGGVVSPDVQSALTGSAARLTTVVAGLGGRAVTKAALRSMLDDDAAGRLPSFSFLDVHQNVVDDELAKWAMPDRSGSATQNVLRRTGVPASRIG
jgi:pyruvate ferredoxin oxidoreductase alpha subunit